MEGITSASPRQKGASMLQFQLPYGADPLLHDRAEPHPDLCDALHEKKIKTLICHQMEGGEKVFRSRYERILS